MLVIVVPPSKEHVCCSFFQRSQQLKENTVLHGMLRKVSVRLERFICNQDLRGNFQKDVP